MRPRNTTYDEKRPSRNTGSDVTVSSAWTIADFSASSVTGLARTASVRRAAPAATPPPTSRQATATRMGRPRAAAAPSPSTASTARPIATRLGRHSATRPPAQAAAASNGIRRSAGPGLSRVVEGRHGLRS